ncbi:unnamed protein product, partial [Phaeothamnion confervicola]
MQNHTPEVIVVDEISRYAEAVACRDIKERGVRVVATAHGDFTSLLGSPELNTVLGGKTQVIIGDAMAKKTGGSKLRTERAGAPVFDVVVELRPPGEDWLVINDVAAAVDEILKGNGRSFYRLQRRRCKPAAAGAAVAGA